MSITETNMASLRSNLADALDSVAGGNVVIVKRRGKPDAALIDVDAFEDFIAATNPRLTKKVSKARTEEDTLGFESVFADVL